MLRKTRYCSIFGLCLGLCSLVFGIFWERIFYKFIEKKLILGTESPIYNLWHTPPMDIIVDIYLFNWTNPQDFRNPDIKPKFEELGPYRFSETQEKVDIVWHAKNSSVSYRKKSLYHFIANGSRGSLDDVITTFNSVALTASTVTHYMSTTQRYLAEIAMMTYPRDLTIRQTVNELLFAGYADTLMKIVNFLPISSFDLPFDKFGYCYGRNDSNKYFGIFNVHTGGNNIKDLGQMNEWNHKDHSEFYNRKCSKIRGSASEFMGPYLEPNGTIRIFGRELCRDVPLEYDGVVDVDGIEGFRYIGGLKAIDNGTLYPENACLCNGDCLPSGVMNITSCWFNAPMFVSYPHFYKADPYYLSQVDGLKPQQAKHEFTYVVEPKTSIPLDIVARSQMNIYVKPIYRSRMFHDVRKIMFPLFWGEIRTRLTPDLLNYIRSLAIIVFYGKLISGILCVSGFLVTIYYTIIYRIKYKLISQLDSQGLEEKINHKETHIFDINQILDLKTKQKEKEIERNCQQPLLHHGGTRFK